MKLAILGARGIPARYGGFETFAERLATGLTRRGIEVTVYCEDIPERLSSYEGVRLEYRKVPKLGPLSTILFDVRCLWHARRRYDVVYMLGYGAAFFCFLPRIWKKKVWINMDGIEWARSKWNWPARFWLKAMEGVAIQIPDRVIADAEEIGIFLKARYRKTSPISVIPYGADVTETAPDSRLLEKWKLSPDDYCLVVCRLEPENHVLEILKGYEQSAADLPLVVVGDHEIDTSYVRRLKMVKDGRIKLIGTVYDQEKLNALRYHCRVYFHGHSVGGTNPSLLEAMGCGNMVITHDNRFSREVLGESGFYFGTEADIPALLDEALSCNRRQSISIAAMDRIRQRYSWEGVMDSYCSLLKER